MHNVIYKEFGERLADLRKRQGLTQSDVAEKLGTTQSTYSGYELGTRKVTLDLIRQFSAIFHVSTNYLTGVELTDSSTQNELKTSEFPIIAKYRLLTATEQEQVDNVIDNLAKNHRKSDNDESQKKPTPSKRDELLEMLTANPRRLAFIEQLLHLDSAALEKVERILDIVEALPAPQADCTDNH